MLLDLPLTASYLTFTAAVLILLILFRIAFIRAKRISYTRKRMAITVTVKWGRERIAIPLPPPDTKLAAIRRGLAEYTHLPEHSFKLVHSGAVMKDDNAPSQSSTSFPSIPYVNAYLPFLSLPPHDPLTYFLVHPSSFPPSNFPIPMILPRSFLVSAYNIRGNSTIAMIGDTSSDLGQLPPTQSNTSSSMQKTESSTISQIRSELDTVRNSLTNDINSFLHAISSPSASNSFHHSIYSAQPTSNPDPIPIRTLEKEHTRLAELLLQALLRLDAITTDGAWEDARRERKDAVREVQGLLDRLDGGWRGRAGVQIKLARK